MSPVVGVVLLLGIVLLGASLVVTNGVGVMDDLESEANAEQTLSAVATTEKRVATAAFSDESRPIPFDDVPASKANVTTDGRVVMTWYDERSEDPEAVGDDCRATIEELGAIEYELEDRTIAYQSGAVWERTDGGTTTHSRPDVGYDGETLSLGFVQLSGSRSEGSSTVATPNRDQSRALAEEIEAAADCDSNNNDVRIRITSRYHDGWYRHLASAFGNESDSNVTVTHHPDDERVDAVVTDVGEAPDPASFAVDADHGILGADDQRFDGAPGAGGSSGPQLEFGAAVENRGDPADTQSVSLSIDGTDVDAQSDVTLEGGESETVTFKIPPGHYKDELEFGETYEYVIATEDDHTDTAGSFYYGEPGSAFELSNETVSSGENDTVVIGGTLANVGVENGTRDVGLDLEYLEDDTPDGYDLESVDVSRTYGEESRIEWVLNESRLLQGDHAFTITIDGEHVGETVEFAVSDAGVDPGDTELRFDENATVNVSVLATESSYGTAWDSAEYDYRENLHPIHASIIVTDEDGDENHVEPWENDEYDGFAENNLNTQETREKVWTHSMDVESNSTLTVRGNSYYCTDPLLDGDGWEHAETVAFEGDAESGWADDDGEGDWGIHDCATQQEADDEDDGYDDEDDEDDADDWYDDEDDEDDEDDGYDEEWYEADASEDENTPHVRVRDAENNALPELRGFHPKQRSADDILEAHGLFGGVDDDGTPYLDLEDNEFVFLFELSDEPADGQSAAEFFQQAIDDDSPGDPNFNDMIVYVEVDQREPPESIPEPDPTFDGGDDEPVDVGTGESSSDPATSDDRGIEVDTTYIVIE